jgi:signal transduction histidine kinase
MIYHLTDEGGTKLSSNAEGECLDCILDCTKNSTKVECRKTKSEKRIGKIFNDNIVVFLCDEKFVDSTRMFKKELSLLVDFSGEIHNFIHSASKDISNQIFRLLHNLITYNAHILQDIYSIIPQDELPKNGKEIVNAINNELKSGKHSNAVSVLRILKNANLMKSEFSIFKKLYDPDPSLNIMEHEIHKVVFLVFNSFWYDLIQNGNFINIQNCTAKIPFDYESVTAALAHIIDNTCKYIAPNTELNVNFLNTPEELAMSFDMMSTQINKSEVEKIFMDGYSGETPKMHDLQGKGIGLYMVKRLLALNKADITVQANPLNKATFDLNGITYQNNVFQIIFKKNGLTSGLT